MAEKKNNKSVPKKQASKSVSVSNANYSSDINTEILNKILICLYALIIILIVNTAILLVKTNFKSTNNNEVEEQESTEYDVSMFTKVTAENLKEAIETEDVKIVYVGRSTCGYCVKFLPVLQKAQTEYNYETLYLDITTVTTTEQQDKILELDNEEGFLSENFGGTPMVLMVQDGKIIDTWMGYAEYSTYTAWLEKNGFTK